MHFLFEKKFSKVSARMYLLYKGLMSTFEKSAKNDAVVRVGACTHTHTHTHTHAWSPPRVFSKVSVLVYFRHKVTL